VVISFDKKGIFLPSVFFLYKKTSLFFCRRWKNRESRIFLYELKRAFSFCQYHTIIIATYFLLIFRIEKEEGKVETEKESHLHHIHVYTADWIDYFMF